ncbi:MAG: helix-turn-helix transcriptional regulator [SAR324 cluster bacterium]|nr:helix-turn-helix transcriptional regulator [SAR324 cluster bacterium]
MTILLSTKEVAKFLNVNEKMVYTLVAEKGLPANKITGKWSFPKHLVEQWIEINTINYPKALQTAVVHQNLLIITGSNDPLLDRVVTLFNKTYPEFAVVFGNMGIMGGLRALRQGLCHIAACHLMQDDEEEYNFNFADSELENMPAVINLCKREQGLLLAKGNPKMIHSIADLAANGIRIVNRSLGTGTRLLFDRELEKIELNPSKINGYEKEMPRHLDAGLEILAGRADAAPGIRVVASLLNLDFMPLRWERFDLLVPKEKFFEKTVQAFLGLLNRESLNPLFDSHEGYDLSTTGKIVYPH